MEADHIISQLDLSGLTTQLQGLVRDRSELTSAAAKASKASKEVGFLDRINVFSKSDAERERDASRDARSTLEEAVVAKEGYLRKALWETLPAPAKLRCLIGDLNRAHAALRSNTDQVRGAFDEYSAEIKRWSSEVDAYLRRVPDASGDLKKARTSRRTKADADNIEKGITDTVAACDEADRSLRNLGALLADETGSPMTELDLNELLESALTRASLGG